MVSIIFHIHITLIPYISCKRGQRHTADVLPLETDLSHKINADLLTQIDSRERQRMPNYPQVSYQQSPCRNMHIITYYVKTAAPHAGRSDLASEAPVSNVTSISVVSFRVFYGVQAVYQCFSWTGLHLPAHGTDWQITQSRQMSV